MPFFWKPVELVCVCVCVCVSQYHLHVIPSLGAAVSKPGMPATVFRYPSYVQDIMGFVDTCFLC